MGIPSRACVCRSVLCVHSWCTYCSEIIPRVSTSVHVVVRKVGLKGKKVDTPHTTGPGRHGRPPEKVCAFCTRHSALPTILSRSCTLLLASCHPRFLLSLSSPPLPSFLSCSSVDERGLCGPDGGVDRRDATSPTTRVACALLVPGMRVCQNRAVHSSGGILPTTGGWVGGRARKGDLWREAAFHDCKRFVHEKLRAYPRLIHSSIYSTPRRSWNIARRKDVPPGPLSASYACSLWQFFI